MAKFVIQKSADVEEFFAHRRWVSDKAQAAQMTEQSARRCEAKLKEAYPECFATSVES